MVVRFAGEGSGVAELSWGQLEILGAMRRQGCWLALSNVAPLPAGTAVDDVADWLRFLMSRYQVLRTRIRFPADGAAQQEVYAAGEVALDVVEAGEEDPAEVAERVVVEYAEHDLDLAREWPIFVAAIVRDGVPAYRVLTVCHVVWDAFGALTVLADLRERAASGGVLPRPVTAAQPLEQARWQRSPAGQRHNEAVLRHWAHALRQMPARRFPAPADRGGPRHWKIEFASPATHLAIQAIRSRTRAGSAQVILTLFLVALARVTGVNPAVARVAVNNRFRRGLADSVAVVTQYGLCVVDVAGVSFDEALARLGQRVVATFKNAYYDPVQLAELVDRIGRERGEELDVHCYFNDRRLDPDGGPVADPPGAAEVRAALPATALSCQPLTRRGSERLLAAVEEAPGTFQLTIEADTRYLSREDLVACARAMEEAAVAAGAG
ncbi:condensation domain-containing protein [Phytohabitans sp. ZYX-F-186]|uniref:Condensation domain-containing protein n=1 Tax=Phytohabitans maris TaxID=3071409 RepID=A0ABU0ZH21_9ACTN|nr:condensation domain-containing protein [Phytohabitans sp. ZYX-F-186]MDQ7906360.1 condensation domain-containing protein [Phytohabitans sp. ZYX-F-186]